MEIDLTDLIIEYENGDTNLTQEILLFAKLVETDKLGHYKDIMAELLWK